MKICCLANAKSKFVQKMEMYCGVGHEYVEHAIGYKIVYGLMDGYMNKNYIVTYDNYFSSPKFVLGSFEGWSACHTYLQD